MKTGVIVAARMGSTRLPGKALKKIAGKPMILFLLDRLRNTILSDTIILATSDLSIDNKLANLVSAHGYNVFRGNHENLVLRYIEAAKTFSIDRIVRVTGDCPLVNYESLDLVLEKCNAMNNFDLATTKGSFPTGIDFEVYSSVMMERINEQNKLTDSDKEHLTWHMVRQPDIFSLYQIIAPKDWAWSGRPFTVDTKDDLIWARAVVEKAGGSDAGIRELIQSAALLNKAL